MYDGSAVVKKTVLWLLKKLNADLRCSPAIAFLGVYPELKQGLE
jgi:hypothetical protein